MKEAASIPKELLINLYYDWRDHNYEEMGEWFAHIREILFEQETQSCLAEQVIASCDSPEEDKAWEYLDSIMNVFEIRNAVLEKLNEKAEEFKGWEANCSLDTFEFGDDDYMDNYLMYRISNHDKEISYRFHHHIHNREHHCWWYNFDTIFDTTSDQTAIDEMVKFITSLTRRKT